MKNLKDLTITLQDKCVQKYSTYINAFAERGIILSLKIKKVSFVKNMITLTAEFKLTPQNKKKSKNEYWKYFAQKIVTLKTGKRKQCKPIFTYKSDVLLRLFLKHNLFISSKKENEKICKENISNYILRIVCFSRFQKFPCTFRGHDLSVLFLFMLLLFLAIIIGTSRTWYAWW